MSRSTEKAGRFPCRRTAEPALKTMRKSLTLLACLAVCSALALPALAGEPKIFNVRVLKTAKTNYVFQVTVSHNDDSWDHFVDRWEVVGAEGKVIATRLFVHPHIGEEYWMRELSGVTIPEGVEHVIVRAHDKVHGYGTDKLVELPTDDKPDTGWK